MPLYFAYGSNMDVAAMASRCPHSRPVGPARLMRHRFLVTSDGYASVQRDPAATVWGLLWDTLPRRHRCPRPLRKPRNGPVLQDDASRPCREGAAAGAPLCRPHAPSRAAPARLHGERDRGGGSGGPAGNLSPGPRRLASAPVGRGRSGEAPHPCPLHGARRSAAQLKTSLYPRNGSRHRRRLVRAQPIGAP